MIVRRPTLQEFLPSPLVCLAAGDVNVTLSGDGFVRILDEVDGNPTVLFSPTVNTSSPSINLQVPIFCCVVFFCRFLTKTLSLAALVAADGV